MKPIILSILIVASCYSVSASVPASVPAAVEPLVVERTSIPVVEIKADIVQPVASSTPSFCGQADIAQMLLNTDLGRKLQLQQQEAIRQALAQVVAEGKIPAEQNQQPLASDQKQGQTVDVPTATEGLKPLKK